MLGLFLQIVFTWNIDISGQYSMLDIANTNSNKNNNNNNNNN